VLTLPQAALAFATLFVAGLVTGLTGFGLALIATPLLVLILPPRVVVPLLALHGTVNNLLILYESRRSLDLRRIWLLTLAGMAGVPFGAYLLAVCEAGVLKAAIGVAITISALAFLLGFKRHLAHERLASVPIGLVSGLLNGSMGMAGPPVILFFANQGVEKATFRANLVAYFTAVNLVTVPAYLLGGLITRPVATYAALLLPALAVGLWAGIGLARRVDEQAFRRVVLLVVGGAGLLAVVSGMGLL
jgi:uncharacterized membrane protein YfcA